METSFSNTLLWTFPCAATVGECTKRVQVWSVKPDLRAVKRQSKTAGCIKKSTSSCSLLTPRLVFEYAGFGPSLWGNTSTGEQTLTELSIEWMPVHLLLLYLCFCNNYNIFFFCSVEFPKLSQLFSCYLEIVTGEHNASSCFGRATADNLNFCRINRACTLNPHLLHSISYILHLLYKIRADASISIM